MLQECPSSLVREEDALQLRTRPNCLLLLKEFQRPSRDPRRARGRDARDPTFHSLVGQEGKAETGEDEEPLQKPQRKLGVPVIRVCITTNADISRNILLAN